MECKCFIANIKTRVRVGFYRIPLRYCKKYVAAVLFVYCSSYPTFVLGVLAMESLFNMILVLALKPYRLKFEQYLYPLFDLLFAIFTTSLLALQL